MELLTRVRFPLGTHIKKILENNIPYDKNLIGNLLAFGAENAVYFYNRKKEVIKFPMFFSIRYIWNSEKYCKELKNGFETLKKHIPQNLNQSQIHFYEQNGKQKYAIIEPFIDGAALTKKDLVDEAVKVQFLKIVEAKKTLEEKEKIFIDLFGSWGLWLSGRWQISNLLIEKNAKKIYLVDIGTAKLDDDRLLVRLLVRLANKIQASLLKLYI